MFAVLLLMFPVGDNLHSCGGIFGAALFDSVAEGHTVTYINENGKEVTEDEEDNSSFKFITELPSEGLYGSSTYEAYVINAPITYSVDAALNIWGTRDIILANSLTIDVSAKAGTYGIASDGGDGTLRIFRATKVDGVPVNSKDCKIEITTTPTDGNNGYAISALNIHIYGGNITTTNGGLNAFNTITLSYSDAEHDSITVPSYVIEKGTVSVADGKYFKVTKDDNTTTYYTGKISNTGDISGVTLTPAPNALTYINADGEEIITEADPLPADAQELSGTYGVKKAQELNAALTIPDSGTVNLILGNELTISTDGKIGKAENAANTTLNIYSEKGAATAEIIGGLEADTIVINGVSISGDNAELKAGTINIYGGNIDVNAIGQEGANITLSYVSSYGTSIDNTSIKAGTYAGNVRVADNQYLTFTKDSIKYILSGDITDDENDDSRKFLTAIAGQTLTPLTSELITISIDEMTNGKVTVASPKANGDSLLAGENDTVMLKVTPDNYYQLKENTLTVKKTDDETAEALTLTADTENDGIYTFTMPDYAVTVAAEFELVPITYFTYDGTSEEGTEITTNDFTLLTSQDSMTLTGGTIYVARDNVTISKLVLKAGDGDNADKPVTIVIENATLEVTEIANDGSANVSLNIWGNGELGKLNAGTKATAINLGSVALTIGNAVLTVDTSNTGTVNVYKANVNGTYYNDKGISYTVTFIYDNDLGSRVTQMLKYGQTKAERPVDLERTGYVFDNWYAVENADAEIAENATAYDFNADVTKDTYIKAKWLKPHNITYIGIENATFDDGDQVTTYNEGVATKLNNPSRKSWTFTGWTCTELPDITQTDDFTIPTTANSDLTMTAHWTNNEYTPEDGSNVPQFAYHALILSGKIGVTFYVYLPDGINSDDCSMSFTIGTSGIGTLEGVKSSETETIGDYTYYLFECPITSIQMADEITATLTYAAGQTVTNTYPAKRYLDYALMNDNEAFNEELKALIGAIKNYGHYAQEALREKWNDDNKYTAMDSYDEITDDEIATLPSGLDSVSIPERTNDMTGIADNGIGLQLGLDSDTSLVLVLTPADNCTLSAKVSGWDDVDTTADNTVTFKGISAHLLDQEFTVTVTPTANGTAGTPFDIKFSALSYVKGVLNDSTQDTKLKKAAKALYDYYNATVAYRETLDTTQGN